MTARSILASILPPLAIRGIRHLVPARIRWTGDFRSWREAQARVSGYDQGDILESVEEATCAVLRGEAAFERDGIAFPVPMPRIGLLAALLLIGGCRRGELRLVDFGGSLGSAFLQHREWLSHLAVSWCVVEQPHFVQRGRLVWKDHAPRVEFVSSITDAVGRVEGDAILISSTLQYLEDPERLLAEAFATGIRYVVFDRTAFIPGDRNRLTVQRVRLPSYSASYPAWFFGLDGFKARMASEGFRERLAWISPEDAVGAVAGSISRGFLYERIDG